MIMEIICIIASMVLFIVVYPGVSLAMLIDMPTLICILALTIPVLLHRGVSKDLGRAFRLLKKSYTCSFSELRNSLDVVEMMQKQVVYAGGIVTVQGILMTLAWPGEETLLRMNFAVALLPIVYAAALELLLLPLQLEAKRRIINYMEKE